MFSIKSNKGITMIALIVMIIIIGIITGITIYYGTDYIEKLKLEGIQTNMISIRAKAKGIAEKVNAETWTLSGTDKENGRHNSYKDNYSMEFISKENEPQGIEQSPVASKEYECYKIGKEALDKMSLDDIEDEEELVFYVLYETNDFTNLDIVYETGIEYKGNMYYSLSKMQEELSAK